MSDAILCPQCEKRYKLPENPPATFTCKQCGTLIDLSAFGGGAPPPPPTQRTRPRGRRAPPGRQPAPRAARQQQAPIMGIVLVVLIVIVLIAARSGGEDSPRKPKKKPTPVTQAQETEPPTPIRRPVSDTTDKETSQAKRNAKRPKVADDGSLKIRLSRVELKPLDWPEGVSDEVKQRTDEAIRQIYAGGRESVDAEAWLIEQGRPIAGRLISEFASIEKSPGFDNRDGTSMAMVIDAILHKIDGFIERSCKERGQIKSTGFYAGQSFITRTAKRWTWWWESGEWQSNPQKPWDPFEDESDETPSGMKSPEKKDPKKGTGFQKRAGSG